MELLQQITNLIPIIYKFLVITKTHLPLPKYRGFFFYPMLGDCILVVCCSNYYLKYKNSYW